MLEDPAHNDIVRWSATGDSFIVVDTNLFTTKILPQHFKHSNFASFVRQLNKYDFHKIKNTEEGSSHQNGEFKHPEFTKDSKDNLDSIRRKAPQPRKNQQQIDEAGAQQLDTIQRELINLRESQDETSMRLSKTIEQCNSTCTEMGHMQRLLGTHINFVRQHEEVMRKILAIMSSISAEVQHLRRNQPREMEHTEGLSPADTTGMGSTTSTSPETITHNGSHNDPLSPAEQVKQLVHSYDSMSRPSLQMGGNSFDQMADPYGGYNAGVAQNGNGMGPMNGPHQQSQNTFVPNMGGNMDIMFNNNDSFGMAHQHHGNGGGSGMATPSRQLPGRKRSTPNTPHWHTSPSVLLVEDDPTCRRIGAKFLQNAHCTVDLADDGLIAVNKMRRKRYDLVLMDIMMPNLDGCTAAHLIRQFEPRTPIIAMTSNIRTDDINAYFSNGMTDVLPKPFTKDGLLQLLERMLGHLKEPRSSMGNGHIPPPIDVSHAHVPDHPISEAPKTTSIKFSASPIPAKSPGTAVMYGHGGTPEDMGGEQGLPQVHTPVTMEDGYMGIMGGYNLEGNTPQPGGYGSPSSANKRRRDGHIGHQSAPPEDMYHGVDMKRQRY
ncbi:hypothetical protein EDC01DRAFT_439582 [Geopyxis carbonaria]|nr:hypothetical protein EDC01DRAFT_439582 [Geopyxis carbonaria]